MGPHVSFPDRDILFFDPVLRRYCEGQSPRAHTVGQALEFLLLESSVRQNARLEWTEPRRWRNVTV